MKLTLRHSILIAGFMIALTSLIDTYTARVDARCDAFYKSLPQDISNSFAIALNDPNVPWVVHKGYERMHGITMEQCASRIK